MIRVGYVCLRYLSIVGTYINLRKKYLKRKINLRKTHHFYAIFLR